MFFKTQGGLLGLFALSRLLEDWARSAPAEPAQLFDELSHAVLGSFTDGALGQRDLQHALALPSWGRLSEQR